MSLENRWPGTISDFFSCSDETVCIDDDLLLALDLDDFGAAIRGATVIYKSGDITSLRSYPSATTSKDHTVDDILIIHTEEIRTSNTDAFVLLLP